MATSFTASVSIDTVTRPDETRPPLALSSVGARPRRQTSFPPLVVEAVPVEDDANDSLDELMQEIDRRMVDDSTHPEQRAEVHDPVVD